MKEQKKEASWKKLLKALVRLVFGEWPDFSTLDSTDTEGNGE